ncbi:hypothetical protein LOAG_07670 [Loa loa]|uniref:Uncharacterized protein n=1 Tax=Loa loa TaxID=7209 RepID=A0A1S0TVK5_LOALO|nr:hypothetical protein LOAG_07670 [Loa loa]EFO20823.1 hypothetical protein LOAG_07670 [Loa loa]
MAIFSIGCMTDTSSIKAHFEEKVEADYHGKTYLFCDNNFSDDHTANRTQTKTTCDGYRLWRPF